MTHYDPPLRMVLDKAGGPSKLASALGIGPSAVAQWARVPARHLPRIEALTGIPGDVIRPDLYAPLDSEPVA